MQTKKWLVRALLVAAGTMVATGSLVVPTAHAQTTRPLTAANFELNSPRGFGDRDNSWAQSMVWWKGHLYVGTGRAALCTSLYSVWQFVTLTLGQDFADTWSPYPPPDPDLSCAAEGVDLSIQAEIWRWTPATNTWDRVFQSPLDLDHPGAGSPLFPPIPGKKLPYEITIRGMKSYIEPDGTDALYAFGVNSTIMWDRTQLPPPRILRSTDGINWAPLSQTPGTFLGDLPFNPDHSSFRSPAAFNGKLFVLSGPVFGQGQLIASPNPQLGDDAWFLASPPGLIFYEMASFNGWLYLGTFSPLTGYSIVKTKAEGPAPYEFVTVIPSGAFLPVRPSKSVVSMHVYAGRLFVGTGTQTEVIRINPDDTWDLVVGPPREATLPNGTKEWKYPISGLDAGFGQTLNDHAWQMDNVYKFLYVGTYNASTSHKQDPVYGPLLEHTMGAHLYRSPDGWYYGPVTMNGFSNLGDPFGGKFDYGIRTIEATPYGAFFGTANDYYGLMIFRAKTNTSNVPDPLTRVEIEPTVDGHALVSWEPSSLKGGVVKYQIWRGEIINVLIRDDVNIEGWSGETGNKIPDTYIAPYEKIGTTDKLNFIDVSINPAKRYMYYIVIETQVLKSEPSNLVTFPLLTPSTTFASLLAEVDRVDLRQRYKYPLYKMTRVRKMIVTARTFATQCKIADAIKTLVPSKITADVPEPESTDLVILMAKLSRRLSLFTLLPQEVVSTEFCTLP